MGTAPHLKRAVPVAAAISLIAAIGLAQAVEAHALLVEADPPPGANLTAAPGQIVLTFGEAPDPALSFITVTEDSSASAHSRELVGGRGMLVGAPPLRLTLALPPLGRGAYRVNWRVVSAADGAATSGSYLFYVGVPPATSVIGGAARSSASFSLAAVGAHWLLYLGLFILVGTSFVVTIIYGAPASWAVRLSVIGLALAGVGLVATVALQAIDARVGIVELIPTVIGRAAAVRAVPVLVAAVAVVGQSRRGQPTLEGPGIIGIAAAATLLADAAASHAAAIGPAHTGGHAHIDVLVQWLHMAAAGAWLGGLLALLVSLRGCRGVEVAAALRRFAIAAMLALTVVAVTGTVRAASELQSISDLIGTDFGRVLMAKSALLALLAALGAVNHFRNVPAAASGLRPLRRIGSLELAVAATVLMLSASLVNLPPPQHSGQAAVHAFAAGAGQPR